MSKCTADREIMERFKVKIVEKYRTALTRQVGEAIHIRGARGALLNDRDEYNRCELPKLSVTKARQKDPVTEGDLRRQRETENLVETLAETQHKRRNRDDTEERNSREPERETQNKRRRDNTQVTQRTHPQRDKRTGETGEVVHEVNLRDDAEVVQGTHSQRKKGETEVTQDSHPQRSEKRERTEKVAQEINLRVRERKDTEVV